MESPFTLDLSVQQCGSYAAWDLPAHVGIIDRAWRSRVGHGNMQLHRLVPFAEPSIVIRRHFDREDRTLGFAMAITPSELGGGCYHPAPGEELFGVRLAPERMQRVLGMHAAEFADTTQDLPQGLRAHLDHVLVLASQDRFVEAWTAMVDSLASRERCGIETRLEYAADRLRAASGRLAPSELARIADLSPRHLRRGFVERFGLAPRAMARRLRLAGALIDADADPKPQWAAIAAGHRFSDQAHLVRECRAILGQTPGEVHAIRRTMAVSFNT